MNRPMVYICSPLRGDYDNNIDNAISYSCAAFTRGYIPITPHIYFTRFLNDDNEMERAVAMDAGLQLLRMCSEVWVFGLDDPSEGMQAEIAFAIRNGIKVRDGFEILKREKNPERMDGLDGFISLKEIFERAGVPLGRKEGEACRISTTTKAIRILPHGKQ